MILRAIEIKGWRCFANRCRIGEFGEGINIVHAPNAAGKSTLFESLQRGLFDGHKVGGEEIEQLKSWGRDLTPSVQIEFAHRGVEYRLVKRFLRDRAAELYRRENDSYVLKAEGESADVEARTIFSGEAAGRGAAREQHWGLAQILWAPQGKLACSELPRGLINSIRGALDLQAADSTSGAIEKRIEALYLEIFSPNGKIRRGAGAPEWVRWMEKLEQLREQRSALENKAALWEEASGSVESQRRARERALEEAQALAARLAQAQFDASRFNESTARRAKAQAEAGQHAARHRELQGRIQQLVTKAAEFEKWRVESARLVAERPRLDRRVNELAEAARQHERKLLIAREAQQRLEKLRREVVVAEQFVASTAMVLRLKSLLAKIDILEAELKAARARREKIKAPDDMTLQRIRNAIHREVEMRAKFEASVVTLQITLERGGRIEVQSGDDPREAALAANEPWQIQDASEIIVSLPGVGQIKASGPAVGSAAALKMEAQDATTKVAELTREFGTRDLAELEKLHDRWKRSAAAFAARQANLRAVLGEQSRATLAAELAAHEKLLAELLDASGGWRNVPPDVAALKRVLGEQTAVAPDAEDAYRHTREAQQHVAAAQKEVAVAESQLASATGRVNAIAQEIEVLRNDGLDDVGRAEALARIALEWSAATATAAAAESELAAFTDDPAVRARTLAEQRESWRTQAERHLADESRARERLDGLGAIAPFSGLAKLDEEIARLEEVVSREKLQADAIKMLHETVKECRTAALTNVSAPVEQQALEIFHRVAGDPQVGAMHLGDTFQLEQISPVAFGERVPLENLSGGEKEQVHLAVRLALALVLAREERQLVVFDDVLIATDAVRLHRILDLLRDVARHLQIIILTCHPERYQSLAGAKFFDLEKIKLA